MSTTTPSIPRRSWLGLVAGVVAVVGGCVALWGWALPLVVASILAMVMVHEWGHFIVARRSGMLVTDFYVGFGPELWSVQRGETRYGIRALPLGGYVKVPGMTWADDIEPALEARTYRSATYPRKVLFASAGSLMHLVMALVLAWSSFTFIGSASPSSIGIAGFETWPGSVPTPAQVAGLRSGDRLVSIDGVAIHNMATVIATVRRNANRRIPIVISRGGDRRTVYATPVDGRHIRIRGVPLSTAATPQGYLGIALANLVVTTSWTSAVPKAFDEVGRTLTNAVGALGHVVSPGEVTSLVHQITTPAAAKNPANQLTRPVSIVGVVRIADQAAQSNRAALLGILVSLNVFVGVLNILPMLPLDGGYVAIATYERLRRRRGTVYRANINRLTPLVAVFVGALGLLFIATLYLDLVAPITNPFH